MASPLVSVEQLQAHPEWCIFDCRHDLADSSAGETAFAQGHIPGAQFLHLDKDLSGEKTGRNGRHPLPNAQALANKLSACGVDNDTQIVLYDNDTGMFAARAWWLLRWLGHAKVSVLDGGLSAWKAANLPTDTACKKMLPKTFTPCQQANLTVDAVFMLGMLGDTARLILDARAPDRFAGQNETLDPVGGHIPGAVNRFFRLNLDSNGRFKSSEALRNEFLALLGNRAPELLIHQCGSGVTACHNLLAMEIAGLPGARLYPGSWSEWCSDPSRPVATDS